MASLHPILKKSYWILASLGGAYAIFMLMLINPWIQRHALYAHRINSGFWYNVSNPEEFGFAKGQVTPFNLTTADGESLFCWHVLPLDVYLKHENEIAQKATEHAEDLTLTVGYKLLKKDHKSKVVINFHGNAGHIADGHRPATYRSISGIPHTHLITCDYRGFGRSTLLNAPHIPTEPGLIIDGVSIVSYVLTSLQHPASRTLLLGQSLGTAVTTATALYFTTPSSPLLPSLPIPTAPPSTPTPFAAILLIAPFPTLPTLLQTYKIKGVIPILSPLRAYPRLSTYLSSKIADHWPTQPRLEALLSAENAPLRLSLLHARNDQDIDFRLSESIFDALEARLLSGAEGALSAQERRSIQGGERVRRGAFAYRRVEDADAARGGKGGKSVELEIVRYGGHNEIVGFAQVGLAVRRAFREAEVEGGGGRFRPGLDVE
ncbi:hypothetical protein EJ04DRAFT_586939 [Polyplosphaeria fusca]|uniref:AB hydrolase-1 domain-containing protein n=1 Tax=Polyplosphaeria fusca TaxID=682080 RepID=A0A9P4R7I1_9PLEO|nr:hypothetical protein EJ04DRAFT_586939 [Polyplosphaeria fusca]